MVTGILDRCRVIACAYTGRLLIEIAGTVAGCSALLAPGEPVLVTVDGGVTWRSAARPAHSIAWALIDARPLARAMLAEQRERTALRRRVDARRAEMPIHERAEKYVGRLDPALAGACGKGVQCGSYNAHAFGVVARVLRTFDLADGDAVSLLGPWAASCDPPLPRRRLERLVLDARKSARRAAA